MKHGARRGFVRAICIAFVLLMSLCLALPAAAAGVEGTIDVDRTGTVTFKITSSEAPYEAIGGGSVAMYKVATIDEHGVYTLLPEFATLGIDLNALVDSDESWQEAAESIALYIGNHSIDNSRIIEINDHGQAIVSDVTTGLYIALQHETPKGYNPFKPFIIPMPYADENGEISYSIIAYPKGTSRLPVEDCVVDLPTIVKTITGTGEPVDTEFRFAVSLYEEKGNYPKLVNASGSVENGGNVVSQTENEIVLRVKGAGTVEIGTVTFDHPGDYIFMISEINTGLQQFKYDKTVYFAKYEIRLSTDKTKLIIANIQVKYDNANGELIYEGRGPISFSFGFENTFRNPPPPPDTTTSDDTTTPDDTTTETTAVTTPPDSHKPPPSLPQTGQVWWPAIALAAAGIFFIFLGILVSKCSGKKHKWE